MRRHNHRLTLIGLSVVLAALVVIAFSQTSLNELRVSPQSTTETVVLWGLSILVGLGVFTLGFILFRSILKLYVDRRRNRLGSKIRTKLVAGALALSILPVVCLVIFSFYFLNRTLDKWFSRPTREVFLHSEALTDEAIKRKVETDARWAASLPEAAAALMSPGRQGDLLEKLRELAGPDSAYYVALLPPENNGNSGHAQPAAEFPLGDLEDGRVAWPGSLAAAAQVQGSNVVSIVADGFAYASAKVRHEGEELGRVRIAWRIPVELQRHLEAMRERFGEYASLQSDLRFYRYFYPGLLALISTFVLFVATWLALFFSRQISVPIEALVEATEELSSGRLEHRVETQAIDELGALVQSFNQMTQQLESKTHELQESNEELGRANVELDSRRRLINAILETIGPGVVSVTADGAILKTNSSLGKIFPAEEDGGTPQRLQDLFKPEDFAELQYMMSRARRLGQASRELEVKGDGQILHLTVTVSALQREEEPAGTEPTAFVVVLEDTTELLRAQKSAAWHEVARRVAHEIKNPLTPIALSAERMIRLLKRYSELEDTPERQKLRDRFQKCTDIIVQEVDTLRTLVDEFTHFARFPTAHPEPADLNRVVTSALDVFEARLDGVTIRMHLAPDLPQVLIDPDQFKRVVVNLIDNALEATQNSWIKEIVVSTAPGALPETVELMVADSGHGISAEDKEKLFLPYFSTRKRGTGLGLAIVNRILGEHQASIRVEDNRPTGSRFIVEVPTVESRATIEAGVSL